MQFTRIRLNSFRCFVDETVDLEAGVTAMYGANGAGKTSLLEACFFALYGADALPMGKTLEDVIEKGEEEAVVELWFIHGEEQYHIRRQVRVYETQTAHDVELTTPDDMLEGPSTVDNAIRERFRMDADAFLNCAYVRQGDINKLITASPSDRQDMIDQLLQLGKLDRYEERMATTRNGIRQVKDTKEGVLEGVEGEIETLETRNLKEQLSDIDAELEEIDDRIESLNKEIETVEAERRGVDGALEDQAELEAEINDLEGELDEVTSKLNEQEAKKRDLGKERDQYTDRLTECEESARELLTNTSVNSLAVEAIEARLEALDERIASVEEMVYVAAERVETLQETVTEAEETAEERDAEAEGFDEEAKALRQEADEKEADLKTPRETLAKVDADIERIEDRFAASPTTRDTVETYKQEQEAALEQVRAKREDLQGKLRSARDQVGHALLLLGRGRCPKCGQEVEDAPNVTGLEEDRAEITRLKTAVREADTDVDQLEAEVEEARDLVTATDRYDTLKDREADLRNQIRERAETIESLREEASELKDEAATKRTRAARHRSAVPHLETLTARAVRARIHLETELGVLADKHEALEEAHDALSEADQKRREREQVERRLENDIEPQIEHWKEERDRIEEDLRETRQELDPERIQRLEWRRKGAKRWQARLQAKREDLEGRRDDLQGEIGGIKEALGELERKRQRGERLTSRIERLEMTIKQCEATEQMYRDLRKDLRTRNVDQLERLLNELFDLLYQTDSYARFELSDAYELTVYEKSGEALDPTDLSGGERALFNLALRCAIYQLLTEGLSGQAPLPPLILDEPTVYLDDQHVNELSGLIARMRELGVDQIIVVSHQEELVDSADERIRIRLDSSSNRSEAIPESRDLLV